MKNLKLLVVAVLVATLSQFATAGKIVVFEPNQAMMRTEFAKKKMTELRGNPEYTKLKSQVEGIEADIKSLAKDAQSNGLTWSAEQREANRKKQAGLMEDGQHVLKKFKTMEQQAVQGIIEKLGPATQEEFEKVVKAKDIDMVLKYEALHYAKQPENDITLVITDALNKRFK